MPPIISIRELRKTYATGFEALKEINLDIERGVNAGLNSVTTRNGAGDTITIGSAAAMSGAKQFPLLNSVIHPVPT